MIIVLLVGQMEEMFAIQGKVAHLGSVEESGTLVEIVVQCPKLAMGGYLVITHLILILLVLAAVRVITITAGLLVLAPHTLDIAGHLVIPIHTLVLILFVVGNI